MSGCKHFCIPVEVVAYSAAWPREFDRVAADLSDALAEVSLVSIEHVGSTSVPGLAASRSWTWTSS